MAPLRTGIIGMGRSGRNIHAEHFKTVPEQFEITAVADTLEDRCQRAKEEYGCDAMVDYQKMLARSDLDLVVNATPSHLHVPITTQFLEAGFTVLCEKPLAARASDVDDLLAAEAKGGGRLAVFQQSRFAPYFRKVCEILDSGVLGSVRMVKIAFNGFARRYDWQTLRRYNGGNLLNTGPHPLDQALHFLGRDAPPTVWCRMDRVNTLGDAEDFCKVLLSREGHPVVDIEICSDVPYPTPLYRVYATYGGITATMTEVKWSYYRPEEVAELELKTEPLPGPSYCSDSLVWHRNSWNVENLSVMPSMAAAFYDNLHAALTRDTPLEVPPQQVRQQIAVIEECHRQNPQLGTE